MEADLGQIQELLGGLLVVGLLGVVALWMIAIVGTAVFLAEKGRRSRTTTTDDDWFGGKSSEHRPLTYVAAGDSVTGFEGFWALHEASVRGMAIRQPVRGGLIPHAEEVNAAIRWLVEHYPGEFEVG